MGVIEGIHATALNKSTYYTMDDMADVIRNAHQSARARHAAEGGENKPIMGHDVLVSMLWEMRDFWEWLVPGYTEDPKRAFNMAAFISYDNLHQYRDFLIKREDGSTVHCPRVGLWARQFMTDKEYKYIGTLTTKDMFDKVVGKRLPRIASSSKKERRSTREIECLKVLRNATLGQFREQFSASRLADAIAVLEHNWDHFNDKAMPPNRKWLPHELAARMRADGKLGDTAASSESLRSVEAQFRANYPTLLPPPVAAAMRQRSHSLADVLGVRRGDGIDVVAMRGATPQSDAQFEARPRLAGCFVMTFPSPNSVLARLHKPLRHVVFWVWRILGIFNTGDALAENNKGEAAAHELTYEAQLYCPTDKNAEDVTGQWGPCFDKLDKKLFLRTPGERADRNAEDAWSDHVHKPLTAFLRTSNLVGGGFLLTPGNKLPTFIQGYGRRHIGA